MISALKELHTRNGQKKNTTISDEIKVFFWGGSLAIQYTAFHFRAITISFFYLFLFFSPAVRFFLASFFRLRKRDWMCPRLLSSL